jgi:hypothetical protein
MSRRAAPGAASARAEPAGFTIASITPSACSRSGEPSSSMRMMKKHRFSSDRDSFAMTEAYPNQVAGSEALRRANVRDTIGVERGGLMRGAVVATTTSELV